MPKLHGRDCYKNYGSTLTTRSLTTFLESVAKPHAFDELKLRECRSFPSMEGTEYDGRFVSHACRSSQASNALGTIHKKDIVYWRGVSGVTEVGEAFSFYELRFTCREYRFLVEVILFLRASPTSWKKHAECEHKLINLADFRIVPSCWHLCATSFCFPPFCLV